MTLTVTELVTMLTTEKVTMSKVTTNKNKTNNERYKTYIR